VYSTKTNRILSKVGDEKNLKCGVSGGILIFFALCNGILIFFLKFIHYQNPTVSSRALLSGNRGSIYQRRKCCFVEQMMPAHIARGVG
jgi:hypothetical protein